MPLRQAWLNIETCKQLNNITEVFKAWVQKSITDPMIASTERHIEAFLVDIMLNKMYIVHDGNIEIHTYPKMEEKYSTHLKLFN